MARVVGTVWASRKVEGAVGLKMQMIQPLTCEGRPDGGLLAAFDSVGAGPGELVYFVSQYEATLAFPDRRLVPIDQAIVGIVDRLDDDHERVLAGADRGEAGA
ncbi:MAG: ethanolamine utilization protein EutN [Planctomycetota bacterium]|nr:MAG: ethanolamine utilization protein EutN [Planctomycetota bacterium]